MFIDNNNYKHHYLHIIKLLNAVKKFQTPPGFKPYLSELALC